MDEAVVGRVRRAVAMCAGVDEEDLSSSTSLRDDVGLDSLDAMELAIALEATFGMPFPEGAFADVRTIGDLVALVETYAANETPVPVLARVQTSTASTVLLERTGDLTPYMAETLTADALRAGEGARLDVLVAADTSPTMLERVRARFDWLRERGIDVHIGRSRRAHRRWPQAA